MNTFNLLNIPVGYKWFAIDADGKACVFNSKPIIVNDKWVNYAPYNYKIVYYNNFYKGVNWKLTLQDRSIN